MSKKILSYLVLTLITGFAFNLTAEAQIRKYFVITGKIISESNLAQNLTVLIIKNNKSNLSPIPEHGRFRLELDYNSEYQLIFNQQGFLPKTINVNTHVPQDVISRQSNFPNFLMAIQLFKDTQDAANIYGNQIQQINYSLQNDCFCRVPTMFDVEYVDKGSTNLSPAIQLQVQKSKMQAFQVF